MKRRAPLPPVLVRVNLGVAAFGPGKADLLEKIAETGSISGAARQMRMSYKRAWQLVDEMNRMFTGPLIEAAPGGARGGGATLTPLGARIAAAYRGIQEKLPLAARRELALLSRFAAGRIHD
ncbi:MAG TPA: LysR family transcriptional regulator [Rudaea sp.]|nr:LysR family transcriptional regulator [Rudaea sp.]